MTMNNSKLSDSELVSMYMDGKESALSFLVERHRSRIFSYIMVRVHNRDLSDDIFQDTFIKVIKSLRKGKYNDEGKFLPWVLRIAHNLIIDHFRKNKRMPVVAATDDFNVVDILTDDEPHKEKSMIKEQIEDDLRKLIQELPEDQRKVLVMRHYCDLSFKEIAEVTGVSINTALGRMRYALINLRKMIEEHNLNLTF